MNIIVNCMICKVIKRTSLCTVVSALEVGPWPLPPKSRHAAGRGLPHTKIPELFPQPWGGGGGLTSPFQEQCIQA